MSGGGAERAMLNLAGGIAERGYDVDLVVAQAEGPYLAEVPDSVQLVDIKASRVLSSLPALVDYMRNDRPAAMISAMSHANIVALWARRLAGVPDRVLVSERAALSQSVRYATSSIGRLMPWLISFFYPWAEAIVAVSRRVADDLAQTTRIPRERIQVIYNPIISPELLKKAQMRLDHPWLQPGEPP